MTHARDRRSTRGRHTRLALTCLAALVAGDAVGAALPDGRRKPDGRLEVPIEDIPIAPKPSTEDKPGPPPTIQPPDDRRPGGKPQAAWSLGRGLFAHRRNARGRARAIGGMGGTTQRAESAVDAGLAWLAKAQEADGRWDTRKWDGAGHDVGGTGLAVMAFLGAGFTHTKGRYKTTVAKGLQWLAAKQKPSGAFPYATFYEQGIATIAVCEAYALTRSPKVGRMAQKAIDHIVKVQPGHGGFGDGGPVPKSEGDLSVTGWQIMALTCAICSELRVHHVALQRSRVFLKNTGRDYGKSAHLVGNPGLGSPANWAIGMACRQFLGGDSDKEVRGAADALLAHAKGGPGGAGKGQGRLVGDLYFTYYSALAMHQMGGEYWAQWNRLFRDALVKAQIQTRFDAKGRTVRGSWDPLFHRWGKQGGRVYGTAVAVLTLETYYRYAPFYKK